MFSKMGFEVKLTKWKRMKRMEEAEKNGMTDVMVGKGQCLCCCCMLFASKNEYIWPPNAFFGLLAWYGEYLGSKGLLLQT